MSIVTFQWKAGVSIEYQPLYNLTFFVTLLISLTWSLMEKPDFTRQFGCRLRDAMISAGFGSQRSISGVCIDKLADMSGHSVQICRRYLRGEAIPEPIKLVEIAQHLKVSPGWLLFGDPPDRNSSPDHDIFISKKLLHYILAQAGPLYKARTQEDDVPEFLLDLIQTISHINASEEQSRKIINLALSSVNHFNLKATP